MNLSYLMRFARIIQDTLRRSGLAGIDVSHDTDIASKIKIPFRHLQ
jgi:hypothetical protein